MVVARETGRWALAPDDTRIGFDVEGAGEPLVLLAGRANSRVWWRAVRSDLGRRTVAFDYPGTGTSDDAADRHWSTRRFARDVVAVLDAAGIARAQVYGTSMGGKVAQWLALDHPDRVGALVLGCTSGGGAGAVPPDPDVPRRLVARAGRGRELRLMMVPPDWTGPAPSLGDPRMSRAALIGHRHATDRHDAWAALPGITAPTLVLHGGDDEYTPPENGRLLARRIPGAGFTLFDGARHAYYLEERATSRVRTFLDAHPLPAG